MGDQKATGMFCEIYVNGDVPADWSDWFGGLTITQLGNGDAILAGELADQTALFGVLNHIHSVNLPLLGLTTSKAEREPASHNRQRDWAVEHPKRACNG